MTDASDVAAAREVLADSLAVLEDNVPSLVAATELLARNGRLETTHGLAFVRLGTVMRQVGDVLLGDMGDRTHNGEQG